MIKARHIAFAGAPGLGQIDPVLDLALRTAGEILGRQDPGAPRTMQLVRRIVAAGPLVPGIETAPIRRVSDLNPALEKIVFVRENPVAVGVGVLVFLAAIFGLGRLSVRQRGG